MSGYQLIKRVSDPISITGVTYANIDTASYTNVSVVKTTVFTAAKAGTTTVNGMTRYYNKDGVELTEVAQANIDLAESIGKYYWHTDKTLWIIVGKATYADIGAARIGLGITSLLYALETPVVTPIDVVGDLVAYPNGTIYWEPCISGYMTAGSKAVTTASYPISEIRKVVRYDYTPNGNLQEVDVTANVAKDATNTVLTIADFQVGKTYFYDCAYAQELSTVPEIVADVEVENGIISKDFQAAAAAWTLTANEAKATMLITTNAGGAAQIIAPAQNGKMYIIKNTSGQTITIKTASSTGAAIVHNLKATVIYNGTDFEIVAEKAIA